MTIASPDAFEILKQPSKASVIYKQINGDLETNVSGWSSQNSATVSQSTDQAKTGTHSLKVVTNGVTVAEGAYYDSGITAVAGVLVTYSFWVYHAAGGAILRALANGNGFTFTVVAGWNYVSIGRTIGTGATYDLYIRTQTNVQAITFYIDTVQFEIATQGVRQPTLPWVDTSAGDVTKTYPLGHPSPIL